MRYPYEEEIEKIFLQMWNGEIKFDEIRKAQRTRKLYADEQAMLNVRDLLYRAMSKSFNDGIDFQKSGKKGMTPA